MPLTNTAWIEMTSIELLMLHEAGWQHVKYCVSRRLISFRKGLQSLAKVNRLVFVKERMRMGERWEVERKQSDLR